ncbi:hypothetical protein E4U21_002770 [Claviceps maximensis]|nr:hypothetical protein E4U21_002770 [Claviceps maximensis]
MAPPAWMRHPRAIEKAHMENCTKLWIVVAVIAGILVLTGLTTVLVISIVSCRRWFRSSRRSSHPLSIRHPSPYIEVSSKEWPRPKLPVWRTYSDLSLRKSFDAKHEYQRLYMIQKSLASRAAASGEFAGTDNSNNSGNDPIRKPSNSLKLPYHERRHDSTIGSGQKGPAVQQQIQQPKVPTRLVDQHKEWEARLQREGERSLKCHPAIGAA